MRNLIAALALLFVTVGANAGLSLGGVPPEDGFIVDERGFLFRGGETYTERFDFRTFSYSPLKNRPQSEGTTVKFHGQPYPLALYNLGGTEGERLGKHAKTDFTATFEEYVYSLTGIRGYTQRYYPGTGQFPGDSFAEISEANGLGIYTHTGPRSDGRMAFLQPKRFSSNPDAQGIYIGMYSALERLKVFTGETATLRVQVRQQVAYSNFTLPSRGIQKMAFRLHNVADLPVLGDDPIKRSQINYSPNTFNSSPILKAVMQIDPDQSNVSFVGGGFLGNGQKSWATSKFMSNVVWTTYGPQTQHIPFPPTTFTMDINWQDFKDTLRHATFRKGLDGYRDADVRKIFGKGCLTRANWELKSVSFGQEINNVDWKTDTNAMGGSLKFFKVFAK